MARRGNATAAGISTLLVIFLVLLPKGGFRIGGGLPLTWGYGLLAFFSVALLPYRLLSVRATYLWTQIFSLLSVVPLLLLFFSAVALYGPGDTAGVAVMIINFLMLPYLFLWMFPPMLDQIDGVKLIRLICFCMLAAALFGIFNFVWRPFVGFFVNIPFLTTNGADLDPSYTKNIARGFFFKLIATYNNGNIYGAATLILINLFDTHTPERWKRWTLRLALALTLSRTVWFGMVADLLLSMGATFLHEARRFPWLNVRKVRTSILVLGFTVVGIVALTTATGLSNRGGNFLLDPSLGGRASLVSRLGSVPLLPDGSSTYLFAEIVYASAINEYGYIGLPMIVLALCSPIFILMVDRSALSNPTRRAAAKGLILYAIVCLSDGAISLVPVMAFFWFAYMVFLFGLPGLGRVVPQAGVERPPIAGDLPRPITV